MKPINFAGAIEVLTERLRTEVKGIQPSDPLFYSRLHGALSELADEGEFSKETLGNILVGILGMTCIQGPEWHLGKALAQVQIAPTEEPDVSLIMDIHVAVSLAYAAAIEKETGHPAFFLAVGVKHLLTLCERHGVEPADIFEEMLSEMTEEPTSE